MPISEAQKRAVKNWTERNKEKRLEYSRNAHERKRDDPEYMEYRREKARKFYWKHREAILERQRLRYIKNACPEQSEEAITDKEDIDSIVSDITETTIETPIQAPPEPEYIHPFFGKKI